jgi:hypothetical protein
MGKNLDLSLQLYKKGTVLLIPAVTFPGGTTKPKYAILLEDADVLYKRGHIIACFTTSKKFDRFYSWHVVTSAKIIGKSEKEVTTIDCINRIALKERHIKKCKFLGYLPKEVLEEVEEANKLGEMYIKAAKIKIFEE